MPGGRHRAPEPYPRSPYAAPQQPVDPYAGEYPLRYGPPTQPTPAQQGGPGGQGLAMWSALIVIATFVVASVVWLGVTTSQYPTLTVEERQAREDVQTPGEPPAEVPGEQPQGTPVKQPQFALWAPGTKIQSTDHYPQAGEAFTAQSCTVAFSFSSTDGRNFAVTAGHCGHEGDLVWPTTASTAADYAVEAGRYIYSGLYSEGAGDIDVGIIEITDPERYMDLVGKPIDTALYEGSMDPGQRICKTGATTGFTCGEFKAAGRVQVIRTEAETERETHGDIANVCALPGDSGGPVFYIIGDRASIIGVVSGTEAGRAHEACDTPEAETKMMSYSNLDQVMEVIGRVVPNVAWQDQVW